MAAGSFTPAVTNTKIAPRFLIVTDQTSFARALEQHVSIVWPEAECRIHAPLQSGRLHSAFAALGYDGVLLDDRVEKGLGMEWLENLLHRPQFPPIVYFALGDDPARAAQVVERGALDCVVRDRIDHRKLAAALRESVRRRRQELALLRTGTRVEEQSRFGPITILGHRFVRELAVGGNSLVYLAESERAGEMVVLKVLSDDADKHDDHLHFVRFLQEYELISKIRHPNVVRIVDLGIADDHAFIAMEYFPKGDLRAHIAKGMQPDQAVSYLAQMAGALEIVHAIGVLHRDLKPGNVMMRGDGSLALIDFGLAKHFEVAADITATGEIFGTPYYMSPEQGHGHELDERSDLYSLGVIFYEMLTRKKPFLAPAPMAVIYMHANAPRPQLNSALQRYQPILDGLLAARRNDRFSSARELLDRIGALEEEGA
jgi:tRNA A-37 threonylcarbamoyl transferase component Bud32